ncbi:protein of unknown function [Taphrina deformans PYCC 5710]|uniref:Uncharacterized protein n=1 Tax=Taphrina deformans (strain PYCC 5710 / ATCC 11124 / CBS 356.35 / IMI 108563 / JCM 9778 / NBRC 8474) TaxID=1097556 RepID=R4X6X1_TAPDE|nr:protein of unknown function [Taphrina deformans PYCC 5710]|eukprot:CCG80971.1 protein of unknown function [Taphrina deformans PYCC 5710]
MSHDHKLVMPSDDQVSSDEKQGEPDLPSYDASISVPSSEPSDRFINRSYKDNPDRKVASAQSYSSQEVGPSRETSSRPRSHGLFHTWGSKTDARASLQALYVDIITQPAITTADVFSTILETCKKGDISLDAITTLWDGHRPIFWMIVNARRMPGTIDLFLDQDNKHTKPTAKDIKEGKAACLVNDSLVLHRKLSVLESQMPISRVLETRANDTIEIIKTEPPVLGFIANVTFQDFATRYRTNRDIAISFPARHREWNLRLGLSSLDPLMHRDVMRDRAVKIAELILIQGETLPCDAQVRLRHPSHAIESDWLSLGQLRVVTEAMRGIVQARGTPLVAFCGPSKLSAISDWRALEFGEEDFLDASGSLTLQLQVVATKPRQAADADCSIQ